MGRGLQVSPTALPDVLLLTLPVFRDRRGFFLESYNQRALQEVGIKGPFLQDNHSRSKRHVLRGLHFQEPHGQGKLVRVLSGDVFEVAVDMRKSSATFGKWVGITLSARVPQLLWIPEGFAHGFLVLSQSADLFYKTTAFYEPSAEHTLLWKDPTVAIQWPDSGVEPILSEKDRSGKLLHEFL
jgi:dTDP-4-dehydrorhamnose 3,5-epimerase